VQTILVGYDDSEPAQRALERALQLAKAFNSKLVITSVAPLAIGAGRGPGVDPTDSPQHHHEELQNAAAEASKHGIHAELVPTVGHPADTIVETAREAGADLIVVGSRELGVVPRLLGQSTSQTVAGHARCDVMIVH
jgi:nucleotide-binding universal stress UspA family protein